MGAEGVEDVRELKRAVERAELTVTRAALAVGMQTNGKRRAEDG